MIIPTLIELFLSNNPTSLLEGLSPEVLLESYGQSNPRDILESVWKRYARLDLISGPPENPRFYNYQTNQYLFLNSLDFNSLSIPCQTHLLKQMIPLIKSWPQNLPIWKCYLQIKNNIDSINQITEVVI